MLKNLNKQKEETEVSEVQEYNPNDWDSPKIPKACYFATNKKTKEEVLIPLCWGTVHSKDINDCYCEHKKEPTKQELKQLTSTLKERIEELEEELNYFKNQNGNETN